MGDRFIQVTTFDIYRPVRQRAEAGEVLVNGVIRGRIDGFVTGQMNAVVRGSVQAVVTSGSLGPAAEEIIRYLDNQTAAMAGGTVTAARTEEGSEGE